jgi:hypothetical protein
MTAGRIKRTYVKKAMPEGMVISFILRTCSRFDLQMSILTFSNMLLISRMSCDILSLSIRLVGIYLEKHFVYALLYKVVYPYSQKREILQLLEEHITENIVKVLVAAALMK